MTHKSIRIIATLVTLLLMMTTIVGCGAQPQEQTKKMKIALMVQGPAADNGWNQSALNGVTAISKKYGAELTISDNLDLSDFEEYFTNFGKEKYDIVYGHGFSFADAAMKIAPNFPDTFFVVTSADCAKAPNLCSIENDGVQQGFLSGAFAGLYSKSGTIGIVGGMEIPSIIAWAEGAKRGAEYFSKDIKVLINYTGNFEDSVAAKELATAMIEQGADVLLQNLDPAGVGVLEACQEHDVAYVGSILDQYDLAPEVVATSGMADLAESMLHVTGMIIDGKAECKCYMQSASDGSIYLAPFKGKWVDLVSQDTKDKLEKLQKDIQSGALDVTKE